MTELPPITLAPGLPALPLVAAAAALLFLPGYAAATLLLPAPRYRALERLLAAPALTVALLALLTLWASVLRLPLGPPAAYTLLALALALIAVHAARGPHESRWHPVSVGSLWQRWQPKRAERLRHSPNADMPVGSLKQVEPSPLGSLRAAWQPKDTTPAVADSRPLAATPSTANSAAIHSPAARAARPAPIHAPTNPRNSQFSSLENGLVVSCLYLVLFALALGLRLWSTHDVLPAIGADTYHHTVIAALLVERGGLPASYEPYAPIYTFAYHFGFHSLVAWLHWWTGAGVGELVSLAGHLVNAAVALGVAFFVLRLLGDGLVALLAAWLVALLCVFPAYFANWGRFTQASGLLLLPVAAALWIELLRPAWTARPAIVLSSPVSWMRQLAGALRWLPPTLAAALAASGLLLAHYRMAAILALLLAVWGVYTVLSRAVAWLAARGLAPKQEPIAPGNARPELTAPPSSPLSAPGRCGGGGPLPSPSPLGEGARRQPSSPILQDWGRDRGWGQTPPLPVRGRGGRGVGALALGLAAAALVAFALVAPWLAHLRGAFSLGLGERAGDYGTAYYALERLGTAPEQPTNLLLVLLAAVGWVLAWRARTAALLLLSVWAALQLALANPYWWPLPMPLAGRVDLVTVVAALAFPLAVAAAHALAAAWRAGQQRWPRAAPAGALAVVLLGTLLGAWQLARLITPENALVRPADLAAAAWLRASTPPDARVAVRAVIFPWAPDYVVGVDGGYWLPLLAGRATTVLPMLYPGERGVDPAAVSAMIATARALRDAPAAPETVALLRANRISHLYDSGHPGGPALDGLLASAAYQLVYERDGVRILAVQPE